MKYTTLLFDADETLLDFKRAEHSAISATFSHFGLPCGEDMISSYSQINDALWKKLELRQITKERLKTARFEQFCDLYGFDVSADEMALRYMEDLSNQAYLLDGAEKLCADLYAQGFKMYIVTNGIKYVQERRMSKTPLEKYFVRSFISEDIGYEKPSREFFDKVKSEIKDFDADKTLIIGDSLSSDIKGGINAGIDTCWYNPKKKTRPEDMAITYEIGALEELYNIVLE